LKRPEAINFSRKNAIHPFEDASSLEFFAGKNDAKKRPDDLVFTRIFDGRVLDMIELGIDEIKDMASFKVCPSPVWTVA
jgi:ribosome production factor 2